MIFYKICSTKIDERNQYTFTMTPMSIVVFRQELDDWNTFGTQTAETHLHYKTWSTFRSPEVGNSLLDKKSSRKVEEGDFEHIWIIFTLILAQVIEINKKFRGTHDNERSSCLNPIQLLFLVVSRYVHSLLSHTHSLSLSLKTKKWLSKLHPWLKQLRILWNLRYSDNFFLRQW